MRLISSSSLVLIGPEERFEFQFDELADVEALLRKLSTGAGTRRGEGRDVGESGKAPWLELMGEDDRLYEFAEPRLEFHDLLGVSPSSAGGGFGLSFLRRRAAVVFGLFPKDCSPLWDGGQFGPEPEFIVAAAVLGEKRVVVDDDGDDD